MRVSAHMCMSTYAESVIGYNMFRDNRLESDVVFKQLKTIKKKLSAKLSLISSKHMNVDEC